MNFLEKNLKVAPENYNSVANWRPAGEPLLARILFFAFEVGMLVVSLALVPLFIALAVYFLLVGCLSRPKETEI